MIQKANPLTLAICTTMACAPIARGAVTYVDASVNNTVGATSGLVDWNNGSDATATSGTVSTNDSLWKYRTGFGNTGIWEATSSSAEAEDAVQLLTTVSVANGTYDVYVFFIPVQGGAESPVSADLTDNDFPIRAGHLSSSLELFDQLGSASGSTYSGYQVGTAGKNALVGADALTFTTTPTPADDGRPMLYGRLSTTQVVTDGTLRVYIDDFPALGTSVSSDARTWYDGIGYELIPEPSTALLTGLGALALLRRRRVA